MDAVESKCDPRPWWLPLLAASWGILQMGDIVTTYWGLSFPSIMEANPVMASMLDMPFCVVIVKMGLTIAAGTFLVRNTWCPFLTSVPLLLFLNGMMLCVCANNSALIVEASGMSLTSLGTSLLAGAG